MQGGLDPRIVEICHVQRGATGSVLRVGVGPDVDQRGDGLLVALLGGQVQRGKSPCALGSALALSSAVTAFASPSWAARYSGADLSSFIAIQTRRLQRYTRRFSITCTDFPDL